MVRYTVEISGRRIDLDEPTVVKDRMDMWTDTYCDTCGRTEMKALKRLHP